MVDSTSEDRITRARRILGNRGFRVDSLELARSLLAALGEILFLPVASSQDATPDAEAGSDASKSHDEPQQSPSNEAAKREPR